jgi:hypothetical protein
MCKKKKKNYKSILNMLKHLRSFKIPHNTVVFDYVATILLSIMLSYLTKIPLVIWTVITMIVGEGFHYLMNIPSNTMVFMGLLR